MISQFKAQTLSDRVRRVRVGSGQRFRPGSISDASAWSCATRDDDRTRLVCVTMWLCLCLATRWQLEWYPNFDRQDIEKCHKNTNCLYMFSVICFLVVDEFIVLGVHKFMRFVPIPFCRLNPNPSTIFWVKPKSSKDGQADHCSPVVAIIAVLAFGFS